MTTTSRPEHAADPAAVARCAAGSSEALERLYAQHAAACLARGEVLLSDPQHAQDAVLAAFLELWQHPGGYDARHGSVRSWLLRLTQRNAVERLRIERRRRARLLKLLTEQPDRVLIPPHLLAITNRMGSHACAALTHLAPAHREALILAYWGGCTQGEIATLTRAPLAVVKARLHRALLELRESCGSPPEQGQAGGAAQPA